MVEMILKFSETDSGWAFALLVNGEEIVSRGGFASKVEASRAWTLLRDICANGSIVLITE